ncbi:MAG: ABC transporter substrate-binding protein [Chloroflexota bacterium]
MNKKTPACTLLLILLATSLLLGCSKASNPTAPPPSPTGEAIETSQPEPAATNAPETSPTLAAEEPGAALVLVADDISTLDPYRMIGLHPEGSVASHLWDTLTLLNDDLQIEPHLAESWRLVNNFTWEFTLRQGITFHNGEPLDTQAVRFSINRSQSLPGSLETFARDVGLREIEMVDPYIFRLVTEQPVSNLPYYLAFLEILPPTYYSEIDSAQAAVAPVGSGPYQIEPWSPGESLILKAVSAYWKGAPILDQITFQTVPAAKDRLAAAYDGAASLVTDLPATPTDQWSSAHSRLEAIASTQRLFVGLHVQEDSPLADRRVRQALNYAINVEQIVDDWHKGYGERYGSWVNPPGHNPELAPWPYDPALARALLTQAGYPEGFTVALHTPIGVYDQDTNIAQAIAGQLGEIGIAVTVQALDWETYVRELFSATPPALFLLALNSRGNDLQDAMNLSADFAFNPTGWYNQTFEDTLRQAAATFNENARIQTLYRAQAIAYDEAPWIWLWRSYDFYGVHQSLDWTPRRDGLVCLYKPAGTPGDSTE